MSSLRRNGLDQFAFFLEILLSEPDLPLAIFTATISLEPIRNRHFTHSRLLYAFPTPHP